MRRPTPVILGDPSRPTRHPNTLPYVLELGLILLVNKTRQRLVGLALEEERRNVVSAREKGTRGRSGVSISRGGMTQRERIFQPAERDLERVCL